jgi:hypothetical protein
MRLKRFFSNTALGALVATLAMTALPAEAFAQSRPGSERSEARAQRVEARQQRQETRVQRQEQARPAQPAQPPQAAYRQPQPQRSTTDRPPTARPAETRGNGSYLNQARNQSRPSGRVEAVEPQPSRVGQQRDGVNNRYWQGQGAVQVNGQTYGRDRANDNRDERGRTDRDRNGRDRTQGRDNDDRRDRDRTDWRDNRGDRDNDRWRDRDGNRDNNRWGRDRDRDNDRWRNNRDNWRDGYRDGQRDHRRWDRRWRDNNRYDWHRHRSYNRNVFNIGVYYSPYRSWSYRRLDVGYFLDSLFFSSRYWIDEPWQYRLPEVYGPYRWVRYYDDVLLVDTYTGEVVDVIYGFFW